MSKSIKKLLLNRETIRHLVDDEMGGVVGGWIPLPLPIASQLGCPRPLPQTAPGTNNPFFGTRLFCKPEPPRPRPQGPKSGGSCFGFFCPPGTMYTHAGPCVG